MNHTPCTVRGSIDRVYYSSPTFSAGRMRVDGGDWVSFAGNVFATEGDTVSLAGTWEKHPKYGRQFKVDHVAIEMPQDAEGLAQYLANHPEIKGIGPAKARMLAERFGADFARALQEQPEALAEAAHVSLATIETLRKHWQKTRNLNAALTWLSAYGLTHHQVSTLVEKLGNNVIAVLQSDPYLIIREVRGMGFKKVDQVARKLGTPKEHLPRVRAGLIHCVQEALDQGDCWVEYEDLIDRANTLLIMDCLDSRERIEKELDSLIDTGALECVDLGGRFVIALPLSGMKHTSVKKEAAEEYAVTLYGFSAEGALITQNSETYMQGTFLLSDGNILIDREYGHFFDSPLLDDPDAAEETMNALLLNDRRAEAVLVLIEENLLAEAETVLNLMDSEMSLGRKEALFGYLLALQGDCHKAAEMFDQAQAVYPGVCIPDEYRNRCE